MLPWLYLKMGLDLKKRLELLGKRDQVLLICSRPHLSLTREVAQTIRVAALLCKEAVTPLNMIESFNFSEIFVLDLKQLFLAMVRLWLVPLFHAPAHETTYTTIRESQSFLFQTRGEE